MGRYDDFNKVRLAQMMDDPEAWEILKRYAGSLVNLPIVKLAKQSTMTTVFNMGKGKLSEESIEACKAELRALK